jgi:hypothetical protein
MRRITLITLVLGACMQLPPSPQDTQTRKIEGIPGKAVIYIVRDRRDSREVAGLLLDYAAPITIHPRSYYRWEVAPGTHHVTGFAASNVSVMLNAEAGKVYYLRQTVMGTRRSGPQYTDLQQINEKEAHSLLMGATML